MVAITTAMTTSMRSEFFSAGHAFLATVNPTATVASASASVTTVSSMAGVAVGMAVTSGSAGIPANTVVARITSATALTLSAVTTAGITGGTLTIAGDIFNVALIKQGFAANFDSTNTNYTNMSTDELSTAGGYTATGTALTNVSPTTGSTVAWINFSPNPSWSSATFSTAGCMIYNSSVRVGGTSGTNTTGGGRACSVHDFGGNQVVSSGTFTILMPSSNSTSAILRIS